MGFVDIALMTVILAGAAYLLYRSVWKKKGHCLCCDSEKCEVKLSGGFRRWIKKRW